jgi:hypothetical protein
MLLKFSFSYAFNFLSSAYFLFRLQNYYIFLNYTNKHDRKIFFRLLLASVCVCVFVPSDVCLGGVTWLRVVPSRTPTSYQKGTRPPRSYSHPTQPILSHSIRNFIRKYGFAFSIITPTCSLTSKLPVSGNVIIG